jgi:hypothetical protein
MAASGDHEARLRLMFERRLARLAAQRSHEEQDREEESGSSEEEDEEETDERVSGGRTPTRVQRLYEQARPRAALASRPLSNGAQGVDIVRRKSQMVSPEPAVARPPSKATSPEGDDAFSRLYTQVLRTAAGAAKRACELNLWHAQGVEYVRRKSAAPPEPNFPFAPETNEKCGREARRPLLRADRARAEEHRRRVTATQCSVCTN